MQRPPRRLPPNQNALKQLPQGRWAGNVASNLPRDSGQNNTDRKWSIDDEAATEANYNFINHNAPRRNESNIPKASVITFGSGSAPSYMDQGFKVEGTRTGEQVVVEKVQPKQQVARRGSTERSGSTSSPSTAPLLEEINSLKKKITQLQGEKSKLSDKVQKLHREKDLSVKLNDLHVEELLTRRELELGHMGNCRGDLQAFTSKVLDSCLTYRKRFEELEEQCEKLKRSAEERRQQADDEKKALSDQMNKLMEEKRQQSSNTETTRSDLEAQLAALRAELDKRSLQFDTEKQRLEREVADLQSRLAESIREVEESTKKRAEDAFLVAQCRMFVRNICNPGFSVVKDESLVPVDKDRMDPSGYVLVPLTTLLHGYTLLPEEERKNVIKMYDEKRKDL